MYIDRYVDKIEGPLEILVDKLNGSFIDTTIMFMIFKSENYNVHMKFYSPNN